MFSMLEEVSVCMCVDDCMWCMCGKRKLARFNSSQLDGPHTVLFYLIQLSPTCADVSCLCLKYKLVARAPALSIFKKRSLSLPTLGSPFSVAYHVKSKGGGMGGGIYTREKKKEQLHQRNSSAATTRSKNIAQLRIL